MILKFCGFKSEEDIEKVKNLNVDAIGFIHFPRSKRHVSMNQLKLLSKRVPDHIYRVVVLVNPTLDLVKQVFNETNINVIQLHGSESIQLIKAIRKLSPTIKIFKAIPADKYLNRNIEKYEKPLIYLLLIRHLKIMVEQVIHMIGMCLVIFENHVFNSWRVRYKSY